MRAVRGGNMNQIQHMKQKIQQIDEVDAKSLLLLMYAKLDTAFYSGDEEFIKQTVEEIFNIYHQLPNKKLN